MSENKKVPTKCNHCNSTDIVHHVWGRTEYWSCKSCKNEVKYVEEYIPKFNTLGGDNGIVASPWTSWDPKQYGFTFPTGANVPPPPKPYQSLPNTTLPTPSDAFYFDDTDGSIDLIIDYKDYIKNRFPGN